MSRFGISFAGADIVLPGVYTYTDVSAMTPSRGVPSRAVAIIATGRGGAVGALTRLTSDKQIPRALVGGVGAQLVKKAFDGGATIVYYGRVNQATSATLDWGDADVTAFNPGTVGKGLQGKRNVNADRADAVDITIKDAIFNITETFKGLGPLLDITYSGTGTNPQCVVTSASGVTTLTFSATGAAGDTLVVTSEQCATVHLLADILNASSSWSAREVGDNTSPLTDIKTGTVNASANVVKLGGGAATQARALQASQMVRMTPKAGASSSTGSYQFFSGGSEGAAPTTQNWIDTLALLQTVQIYGLCVGSADPAVISAARSHTYAMSSVTGRRERQLFVGPEAQNTKAATITAAKTIVNASGGERVVVCTPGIVDTDIQTGRLTTYPSYHLAAYALGYKASHDPAEPLTNKQIVTQSLQFQFDDDEKTDQIESGIMCAHVDSDSSQPVFTAGITSYVRDANVIYRKVAGMDIHDYLNQKIRLRTKRFIGRVGDKGRVRSYLAEVKAILKEEVRGPSNPFGVLTDGINPETGKPVPAYGNLEAIMDGFDLVGSSFDCHPVGEIAIITNTTRMSPVKIVVTG